MDLSDTKRTRGWMNRRRCEQGVPHMCILHKNGPCQPRSLPVGVLDKLDDGRGG